MADDLLATPWGRAPLLDLDVPALLPTQRTSPRPAAGPGGGPLPVPVPSWWLRERRSEQLRERRSEQLRERRHAVSDAGSD